MTKSTTECFVYGVHAVHAVLANPARKIHTLYINSTRNHDKRIEALREMAETMAVPIRYVSAASIPQQFPDATHQGIIACVEPLPKYSEAHLESLLTLQSSSTFILILDGITDPHNLGACLRSADAAGVQCIITPKDNSAHITPVVSKVACGAAESVPLIQVTNLARTLTRLKEAGVWLFGAAEEATTRLYALDLTGPIGLVLGSEGSGLRRLTRTHCDGLFSLPMHGLVSSLNVSVATGICLYEAVRQRLN